MHITVQTQFCSKPVTTQTSHPGRAHFAPINFEAQLFCNSTVFLYFEVFQNRFLLICCLRGFAILKKNRISLLLHEYVFFHWSFCWQSIGLSRPLLVDDEGQRRRRSSRASLISSAPLPLCRITHRNCRVYNAVSTILLLLLF